MRQEDTHRSRLTSALLMACLLAISIMSVMIMALAQDVQPDLPGPLKLQKQIDDLTAQVRTLEFELAGCRGQLMPYAQQISQEIQARRTAWCAEVSKALPGWVCNDKMDLVQQATSQEKP